MKGERAIEVLCTECGKTYPYTMMSIDPGVCSLCFDGFEERKMKEDLRMLEIMQENRMQEVIKENKRD